MTTPLTPAKLKPGMIVEFTNETLFVAAVRTEVQEYDPMWHDIASFSAHLTYVLWSDGTTGHFTDDATPMNVQTDSIPPEPVIIPDVPLARLLTADQVRDELTRLPGNGERAKFLLLVPLSRLRELADLVYACDLDEASHHGAKWLTREIMDAEYPETAEDHGNS